MVAWSGRAAMTITAWFGDLTSTRIIGMVWRVVRIRWNSMPNGLENTVRIL